MCACVVYVGGVSVGAIVEVSACSEMVGGGVCGVYGWGGLSVVMISPLWK